MFSKSQDNPIGGVLFEWLTETAYHLTRKIYYMKKQGWIAECEENTQKVKFEESQKHIHYALSLPI